jgi:uncharacterized protein (DUF1778 family)
MKTPKKKRGAPKKSPDKARSVLMQFRVTPLEQQAIQAAADLDGKKLSEWIRDRLRRLSRIELEKEGRSVPFLTGEYD